MKHPFHPKYPKILLFVITIILAYVIIKNPEVYNFLSGLNSLSYLGVFIAGMLFAFGFTAPFAVGFFIALNPSNILLAATLGGLGAAVSNLLIFKSIKLSFENEFSNLRKTKFLKEFNKRFENHLSKKLKHYLLFAFAGFLIASPLPDEMATTILAGLTKVKPRVVGFIAFILSTFGILAILFLSA